MHRAPPPSGRHGASWRLILDDEGDAYWNMAVDTAIHDAVEGGLAPPTLRLYRWVGEAITVGCHQSIARSVDVEACAERDIAIVRRPTGGRGILHGADQTVSISAPYDALSPGSGGVEASYHLLASGFTEGLGELGVRLVPGRGQRPAAGVGDCFALRTTADLVTLDGHKLVGSAQHRGRSSLLQQCSVIHRPPRTSPALVFLGPPADAEYPLSHVRDDAVASAVAHGFSRALAVRLMRDTLSLWEVERAGVVMAALRASTLGERPAGA